MTESLISLAELRRQLAAPRAGRPADMFALGESGVDDPMGGGLALARLHEVIAAAPDDIASAAGFALMLAIRATPGEILWITQPKPGQPHLHPPGLTELGVDPRRFLFVDAADEAGLLRAAADAVRSPAVGAVVMVPAGRTRLFDLTASRRLSLAAEHSGVTAFVLKAAGDEAPSSASTRWRVAAAPSTWLEAEAPGHPTFFAELLRHRFGVNHPGWHLEWDRDRTTFRLATPLSGDPSALPAHPRLGRAQRSGPG